MPRHSQRRTPSRARWPLAALLALVVVGVAALGVVLARSRGGPEVEGVADGAVLNAEKARALAVRVGDGDAEVTVDGRRLQREADGLFRPGALPDGEHELRVAAERNVVLGEATTTVRFTVDSTPPAVTADKPAPVPLRQEAVLQGTVEAGSTVTVDGRPVTVEDGRYTLRFPQPPSDPVTVVATDAAGNANLAQATFAVQVPEMRAVHMTALAWAYPALRDPVLKMIESKQINAVELDLKDESGVVGYNSALPRAKEIGAVQPSYDLKAAVDDLHRRGAYVIGRIVAFRDPVYAKWAWGAGRRDEVVQAPNGGAYDTRSYGGISFTNFAHPEVRQYNIDIAREAADAGVDDILYDYIRRPDGPLTKMVFPGLQGTPEDSIASFMADSQRVVRAKGVYLGASVFGIAVDRPTQIAQDVPKMARHADYIAPMVYPSHWAKGEYRVADPNRQPYDIVFRSIQHYVKAVEGTNAVIRPWLQDFSLGGVTYGPAQVRAQIKASADAGAPGFLLWDASATYTAAALDPMGGA